MKLFRILMAGLLILTTAPASAQVWTAGQQLAIAPKNVALLANETLELRAYARTSTSVPVAAPGVTWVSRDTSIAVIAARTNDVADLVARTEGRTWVTALWKTRSGDFMDSVLVVVHPAVLGSLPWVRGQQLLLLPKVNPSTVVLKERDSVFLQGLARTSQGVPVAAPLVQFTVNPSVGTIRRITNATAMLVVGNTPPKGVTPVAASWDTKSGIFRDTSVFFIEPTPPTTDVSVESVILMQATQNATNGTSLVQNREALLRVALRGSVPGLTPPAIRVQLFRDGVNFKTVYASGPVTVPTSQTPAVLASTWNVPLSPADMNGPLKAKVDLEGHVDADTTNNVWPRDGQPFTFDARTVIPMHVRLVPVFHAKSNRLAVVNPSDIPSYIRDLQLMFPLNTVTADIRSTYTTNTDTVKANDQGGSWTKILSEINTLRMTDNQNSQSVHYVGVINVNYSSGIAGIAYVPGKAALVWHHASGRGGIVAHELGHNFGRSHVNACNPAGADPQYPYAGGRIGNVGWNYLTNTIIDTTVTDIMGYCTTQWISDYTWQKALLNRAGGGGMPLPFAIRQGDIVQVSGRITTDSVIVDPVFRYTSTPVLAEAADGRYEIRLRYQGDVVATFPIAPITIDHSRDLYFSVKYPLPVTTPIDQMDVRFDNRVISTTRTMPQPLDTVTLTQRGDRLLAVRWNGRWSSALLIDLDTNEVIGTVSASGDVVFTTAKRISVILSNGLTNQTHHPVVP